MYVSPHIYLATVTGEDLPLRAAPPPPRAATARPFCNEQRERLAVVEEQLAQMHALMTIKDQQASAASLPPLVEEPN